ncbi:DMT family transporter [Pararhizobium sp.]|uniref:DMT family transporter n=1 Tax=Pararhizobium sp. TaxID=1977563 RepID=UPI00271F8F87|nr:DMT family transporter [Pararhizobium sp.]MDO9418968.1 DMT family transporter [Pararhizobium sp.]
MKSSSNLRGAMFMSAAMAGFTANDALVKMVTGLMNTGQIMLVRGFFTSVMVLALAIGFGALREPSVILRPAVAIRILAEVGASLTFIAALGEIPLANVSAILQALPLAVTLGAALFLSEPVGWRRWIAILVGFLGVLIVVRPGPDGFTAASLNVLACVFFAAVRDLMTRRIGNGVPSLYISTVTAVSITLAGAALVVPMGGWQPMSLHTLLILFAASCLLLVGYQCIVFAMRLGEISFVAPFRYTSLIWALFIGILFFREIPDAWVITGVLVIVASGLYTFYRENKRNADPVAQTSPPGSPK